MSNLHSKKPLSVVIPAYNVAPYIADCINSVIQQPGCRDVLDVIVVADGSTDNTLDIIQHVISNCGEFVQIVAQSNKGLATARNNGLDRVKTDYVTFLDGDDVWADDYLASIIPLLLSKEPDLIEYDALYLNEEGKLIGPMKIASAAEGTVALIGRDEFLKSFQCYSWPRVYRTSIVRRHPFPPGIRYEDTAVIPWCYWESKCIQSVGHPLIGYRQRSTSILKTPHPKDIEDISVGTARAAKMYTETHEAYWKTVAHRTFQHACRRITWQSLTTWPTSIRVARAAIKGVPPPPGPMRWIQMNLTPLYVLLIYFKRIIFR